MASAAPRTPQPRVKISSGSSSTFATLQSTVAYKGARVSLGRGGGRQQCQAARHSAAATVTATAGR